MNKLTTLKKIGINILIIFFFSSCVYDYDNMIGTYIKIDNDVKEILHLKNDNQYYREIYDINNNELLIKFQGNYSLEHDYINFNDFYLSFRTIELHKQNMNSGGKTDIRLSINRNIFFTIYIEETSCGEVFAVYEKQ